MTLQQLRQQLLDILRETTSDTNFTTDQLNSFINQAIQQTAVIIEYPRDRVKVQVEKGIGAYTLPSDNLSIVMAYFGDPGGDTDIRKLTFLTEETASELYPSWQNETDSDLGRPRHFLKPDRNTIFIYPRPDAENSASGKSLIVVYVYNPTPMTGDSQEPQLPQAYQNIIKFYAANLCYINLGNDNKAIMMRNTFMDEHKRIETATNKEVTSLTWQWGYDDGVDRDTEVLLIP